MKISPQIAQITQIFIRGDPPLATRDWLFSQQLGKEKVMLKKDAVKNSNQVKLTFILPFDPARPKVSVVGDFNNWDPTANPMGKRNNGTLSTSVTLDAGQKVCFRYFTPAGEWFNDEAADAYEPGDFGADNSVAYL